MCLDGSINCVGEASIGGLTLCPCVLVEGVTEFPLFRGVWSRVMYAMKASAMKVIV